MSTVGFTRAIALPRCGAFLVGLLLLAPALSAADTVFDLIAAAKYADAQKLLTDNPQLMNQKNANQQTPLYLAAARGNGPFVAWLIDHGADLEAADGAGTTPVMVAARVNAEATLKVLIEHGANLAVKDHKGHDALDHGYSHPWGGIIKIIVTAEAFDQPKGAAPKMTAGLKAAINAGDVAKLQAEIKAQKEQAWSRDENGQYALILAVQANQAPVLQALLAAGAPPDPADSQGQTALMIAGSVNNPELVQMLIDKGADPNLADSRGKKAADFATGTHRDDILPLLAKAGNAGPVQGPAPAPTGPVAATPEFETAVIGNQVQAAKDLIAKNPALVSSSDKGGFPMLVQAAGCGYPQMTSMLLDAGADVNITDKEGMTALHRAAKNGALEVVQVLVARGADLTIRDQNGNTAEMVAAARPHPEIAAYLKAVASGVSSPAAGGRLPGLVARFFTGQDCNAAAPLLEREDAQVDFDWGAAAPARGVPATGYCIRWQGYLRVEKAGHYTLAVTSDDGVRLTIDGRSVIDQWVGQPATRTAGEIDLTVGDHELQLDYFQGTGDALCRLAWALQNDFAERPVPAQALWHAAGQGGLMAAIYRADLNAVKAAVAALPALATAADASGRTALHLAAAADSAILSYLLDQKADPNKADAQNWRPLHVAAEAGRADLAEVLLKAGADANGQAAPGDQTPMYIAAEFGFTAVVKQLLAYNANPNLAAAGGSTPLHRAAACGYIDIVSLLILAKADLNVKDRAGKTAEDYAVATRHPEIAALLVAHGALATTPVPKTPAGGAAPGAAKKADPTAPRDAAKEAEMIKAAGENDETVINRLLAEDSNLAWSRDVSGYTALHYLGGRPNLARTDLAQKFLDLGVPIDVRHNWKRTPLHRAAEFGCLTLVKYYVEKGADVNTVDGSGVSALMFAARGGNTPLHQQCVQYLLDHKADPALKDNDDNLTAYGSAKKAGYAEIVKIFEDRGIKE